MRIIYLTGCSKGIGLGILKAALQDLNTYVIGFARSAPDLKNTSLSEAQQARFNFHQIDLSSEEGLSDFNFPELVAGAIPESSSRAKEIILINNAGTLGTISHIGKLENSEIESSMRLNITAPTILANTFINQFRKSNAFRLIINLSSGAASKPYDGWGVYCAGKAASDMLARVLDVELSSQSFNPPFIVRSIAPGVVETAMQKQIRKTDEADFSSLTKFQNLKADNKLSDADLVGEKFVKIIDALSIDQTSWPELIFRLPTLIKVNKEVR
ncbi:MAG: benzil reductase ((S)-benzoin forming) [Limisphaerales bacterium]|jgi:benzil reductase ((S)-benzoin forming)